MTIDENPLDPLTNNSFQEESNFSLREIGELLKKTRLDQKISSKDFADELRIGEGQLLALEEGKVADLPEPVFIRGMVQRVSEKLGLNSQDLVSRLQLKQDKRE